MGAYESKPPSDPVLARIEQEAVRAAIPRGLQDETSRKLEYELNWCYTRNNWFFTAGGLVIGSALGYSQRSIKPIAFAAVLAPAADWMYERHACADIREAYSEHQRKLLGESKARAEEARAEVRRQWEDMGRAAQRAQGGGR